MSPSKHKLPDKEAPDKELDSPEMGAKTMRLTAPEEALGEDGLKKILVREIETEIGCRSAELKLIQSRLSEARKDLLQLRKCIVSAYYQKANKSSVSRQGSLHPAVKRLVCGKAPSQHSSIKAGSNSESAVTSAPPLALSGPRSGRCRQKARVEEDTRVPRYVPPLPSDKKVLASSTEPRATHQQKVKIRLLIGNVSKWLPMDMREDASTHKWMVYIRSPKGQPDIKHYVSKVRFFLHPSYKPNDIVQVSSSPFRLSRRGWGEFPVRIQLHFIDTNNRPVDVIHHLKLDRSCSALQTFGAETVVELWIHTDVVPVPEKSQAFDEEGQAADRPSASDGKTNSDPISDEINMSSARNKRLAKADLPEKTFDDHSCTKSVNKRTRSVVTKDLALLDGKLYFLEDSFPPERNGSKMSIVAEDCQNEAIDFRLDHTNPLNNNIFESIHSSSTLGEMLCPEGMQSQENHTVNRFPVVESSSCSKAALIHDHSSLVNNADTNWLCTRHEAVAPEPITNIKYKSDLVNELIKLSPKTENGYCDTLIPDNQIKSEPNEFTLDNYVTEVEIYDPHDMEENVGSFVEPELDMRVKVESDVSNGNNFDLYPGSKHTEDSSKTNNTHSNDVIDDSVVIEPHSKECLLQSNASSDQNSSVKIRNGEMTIITSKSWPVSQNYDSIFSESVENSKEIIQNETSVSQLLSKQSIKNKQEGKNEMSVSHISKQAENNNNTSLQKVNANSVVSCSLESVDRVPSVSLRRCGQDINTLMKIDGSRPELVKTLMVSNKVHLSNLVNNKTNSSKSQNIMCSIRNPAGKNMLINEARKNSLHPRHILIVTKPTGKSVISLSSVLKPHKSLLKTTANSESLLKTQVPHHTDISHVLPNSQLSKPSILVSPKDMPRTPSIVKIKSAPIVKKLFHAVPSVNTVTETSELLLQNCESGPTNSVSNRKRVIHEVLLPVLNNGNVSSMKNNQDHRLEAKRTHVQSPSMALETKKCSSVSLGEEYKQMIQCRLEGCQKFEHTEPRARWLIAALPLVDSRAESPHFRAVHPYCTSNLDTFLRWPRPKQHVAKWLRAKALHNLLERVPQKGVDGQWTTRQLFVWANVHGYSPCLPSQAASSVSVECESEVMTKAAWRTEPAEALDWLGQQQAVANSIDMDTQLDVVNVDSPTPLIKVKREVKHEVKEESHNEEYLPVVRDVCGLEQFVSETALSLGVILGYDRLEVSDGSSVHYPGASRVLVSAFAALAEDILRRSLAQAWRRNGDRAPSSIEAMDTYRALLSRQQFDLFRNDGLGTNPPYEGKGT